MEVVSAVHALMGEGVVSVVSVGGHTLHDLKDYTDKCKKDKNGQVRRTPHTSHISTQGRQAEASGVLMTLLCVLSLGVCAGVVSALPLALRVHATRPTGNTHHTISYTHTQSTRLGLTCGYVSVCGAVGAPSGC